MGKELKCIQMYKNTDIDPKYKANFIWYVWDIINSVLNILETRIPSLKFQFLKKNVDNLGNLYKYEITKGNMNRRLIYVKYAILLMKKDISVENYENTPCFTNNICVKACANVNDLYRYLLNNKETYEYTKKERKLLTQIKELPNGFMTEEELTERIRRNNENEKKDREIANYFKNVKYGREKIEAEINRINNHNTTNNRRHLNNRNTAKSINALKERENKKKEEELKRQRQEYEKKARMHAYRTNERIRQRKIRKNARRMYRNLR